MNTTAYLAAILLLASTSAQDPPPVRTGLDVLVAEGFASLRGAKVGLISNHTGRDGQGHGIVDLFLAQDACELRVIFSPEHGFDGVLDQAKVDDARHPSGIAIHSLYGAVRKPTPAMLEGLDTLVFDIQDVGARFYTYVATMRLCMEAAAENKLAFVVLDRPNPIGGLRVDGPVLAAGDETFVATHTLPIRHGMTVGELATMMDIERELGAAPRIIEMTGWQRGMDWEDTGLTWIDPSPNMRTPTQAFLYPGVALLETTNLSVGRGTDTPFEILGAPWLDGPALWRALRERDLRGVAFTPVTFTPASSKYAGEVCGGVRIAVTDRDALDPLRIGITLAWALRRVHPEQFKFAGFARLLAEPTAFAALDAGAYPEAVIGGWQPELAAFRERRRTFLRYR